MTLVSVTSSGLAEAEAYLERTSVRLCPTCNHRIAHLVAISTKQLAFPLRPNAHLCHSAKLSIEMSDFPDYYVGISSSSPLRSVLLTYLLHRQAILEIPVTASEALRPFPYFRRDDVLTRRDFMPVIVPISLCALKRSNSYKPFKTPASVQLQRD